jgi:hypothetical protein
VWVPAEPSERCLTLGDTARVLGLSRAQVEAMVRAGKLPTVSVGDWSTVMVLAAEVERLKAANRD